MNPSQYTSLGWHVFPVHSLHPDNKCTCSSPNCSNPGKHPATLHGLKDASLDHTMFDWRNRNVAVRTGRTSGFFVLDLDPRHGSDETIQALTSAHSPFPLTVISVTGGGGRHIFFRHPPDVAIPSGTNIFANTYGPGVDIRADGGYVILPPSLHESGNPYRWSQDPFTHEVAPPPAWIIPLIRSRPAIPRPSPSAPLPTIPVPPDLQYDYPHDLQQDLYGDGPLEQGSRNDQLTSIAGRMRRFGRSFEEMLPELLEINNARCEPPLSEKEVRTIAKSIASKPAGDSNFQYVRNDTIIERPKIYIVPGTLPDMVTRAAAAIIRDASIGGDPIYVYNDTLSRIVRKDRLSTDNIIRSPEGSLRVRPVTPAFLTWRLTQAAQWAVYGKNGDEFHDCPSKVAKTLTELDGEWTFPTLTGIVGAPCLRPDGSVLQTPGHDKETGILFESEIPFDWIPNHITPEQGRAALTELKEVFQEFPYEGPHSSSVALAGIFTVFSRYMYPTAPMFGFSAPSPGSGKSLHADIAAILLTGRDAPATTEPRDDEESAKVILAMLLDGSPIGLIDNIERPFGDRNFCSALTQASFKGRVLGKTEMANASTGRFTWFASGNGLRWSKDFVRRGIISQIDPKCEQPEIRVFKRADLKAWVLENRGRLVSAVLTALRGFLSLPSPPRAPRLGNFEGWSDVVRSCLMWYGEPDPCAGMHFSREEDPDREEREMLLKSWYDDHGTDPITVRQLFAFARKQMDDHGEMSDLYKTLEEISQGNTEGKKIRSISHKLAQWQGSITDGLILERGKKHRSGSYVWTVTSSSGSKET